MRKLLKRRKIWFYVVWDYSPTKVFLPRNGSNFRDSVPHIRQFTSFWRMPPKIDVTTLAVPFLWSIRKQTINLWFSACGPCVYYLENRILWSCTHVKSNSLVTVIITTPKKLKPDCFWNNKTKTNTFVSKVMAGWQHVYYSAKCVYFVTINSAGKQQRNENTSVNWQKQNNCEVRWTYMQHLPSAVESLTPSWGETGRDAPLRPYWSSLWRWSNR